MHKQITLASLIALPLIATAAYAEEHHRAPTAAQAPSPFAMSKQDKVTTAAAIHHLNSDEKISGRVLVETINGEVILSGNLDSPTMIYRSVERLRKLDQVKSVKTVNLDG